MSGEVPSDKAEPVPLPRQWGLGEVLSAEHNRPVVKTLLVFMFAMVALPVTTFFVLHDILLRDAAVKTRTFCSGIAAVLAANIVIAAYAILAIKEDSKDEDRKDTPAPRRAPLKTD